MENFDKIIRSLEIEFEITKGYAIESTYDVIAALKRVQSLCKNKKKFQKVLLERINSAIFCESFGQPIKTRISEKDIINYVKKYIVRKRCSEGKLIDFSHEMDIVQERVDFFYPIYEYLS